MKGALRAVAPPVLGAVFFVAVVYWLVVVLPPWVTAVAWLSTFPVVTVLLWFAARWEGRVNAAVDVDRRAYDVDPDDQRWVSDLCPVCLLTRYECSSDRGGQCCLRCGHTPAMKAAS